MTDHDIILELDEWFSHTNLPIKHSRCGDSGRTWGEVVAEAAAREPSEPPLIESTGRMIESCRAMIESVDRLIATIEPTLRAMAPGEAGEAQA